MPELPDIVVYMEALEQRILGRVLERVQIAGPSLLRTADPPLDSTYGHKVSALRRIGKRIAVGFDHDVWLVLRLVAAGRLHWSERKRSPDGRRTLAAFDFESGCLTLTEAGARKRASLHTVTGEPGLAGLDPGGIDALASSLEGFAAALTSANHTLKRALTDPRLFSGIGNAYSDEILHRARLSPVALTSRLSPEDIAKLHHATQEILREWVERLRAQSRGSFPEKVTAFRDGMAVHGRYGQPCPRCGAKVQRIRFASNETN